jgi:hypothetical protein
LTTCRQASSAFRPDARVRHVRRLHRGRLALAYRPGYVTLNPPALIGDMSPTQFHHSLRCWAFAHTRPTATENDRSYLHALCGLPIYDRETQDRARCYRFCSHRGR